MFETFLETSKPQTSSKYAPQPLVPPLSRLRHDGVEKHGLWSQAAMDLNTVFTTYYLEDPELIASLVLCLHL